MICYETFPSYECLPLYSVLFHGIATIRKVRLGKQSTYKNRTQEGTTTEKGADVHIYLFSACLCSCGFLLSFVHTLFAKITSPKFQHWLNVACLSHFRTTRHQEALTRSTQARHEK